MPLVQLFLYAYALSFDVKHLPTATLDLDRSTYSRQYINALQQSNYFTVDKTLGSYADVDPTFQANTDKIVVVVSAGFGDAIAAGRQANVQILVDGSDANSAQMGSNYAAALSRIFGAKVLVTQAEAKGLNVGAAGGLTASMRTWYNPEGNSAAYFVPGLIVVLVTTITVLQTAATLVREKENGTYEQLIVSPIKKIELMIGKIAPWAVMGALDVVIIAVVGILAFGIPFRGSVLLFAGSSLLYVTCTLGLGLIVSARATSVDSANQVAALVSFLPTFMLSGFVFPLTSLPPFLQWLSYLFPARYFMVICRTVFLKGGSLAVLWPQIAALVVFATVIVVLAASLYRERA
jgi:ABC-2 type transport system permease protein